MFCSNCGKQLPDKARFCDACGSPVREPVQAAAPAPEPVPVKTPEPAPEPVRIPAPEPEHVDEPLFTPEPDPVVPEENRPLGPWAYFGYSILFSIPVVGFICLIVLSLSDTNINRRNYARSFWCGLIIGLILFAVIFVIVIATGSLSTLLTQIQNGIQS